MFRDSKEYQEIAKIYDEKVSKSGELNERVKGGGVSTAPKININIPKAGSGGSGNVRGAGVKPGISLNKSTGMGGAQGRTKRPEPEIKKPMPTTAEIRAKDKAAGGTGMSNIPKAEGSAVIDGKKLNPNFGKKSEISTKSTSGMSNIPKGEGSAVIDGKKLNPNFGKKVKIDTSKGPDVIEPENQSKEFGPGGQPSASVQIKKSRLSGKTGKERAQELAKMRIGSGTAKNPDTKIQDLKKANTKSMKERAKARFEKFKADREAKRLERMKEEYTPYDMVLESLLSTEQAATIEEANYVMMQLDEENIQEIVGTALKGLKMVGKFGAKGVPQFAATLGTAAALGPSVGKGLYKAKETVGNIANKITNFDPIGDARKKKIGDKQKEYREKSGTTKDDGYFYDPTVDGKKR